MTETETYRICVSGSAARLEQEVNEYLAEGWELYGFPFVDAAEGSPGHHGTDDQHLPQIDHHQPTVFCQAIIRPSVLTTVHETPERSESPAQAAAPRVTPSASPDRAADHHKFSRPARPRIRPTFRSVALFLAIPAAAYLFVEGLIFRSGLVTRNLDPESLAGSFERITFSEINRRPSGKKEVLAIGGSRLIEDFSAKTANGVNPADGYWFINISVPQASVRDLYYQVREVDPKRDRYKAILVPLEDYDDPDTYNDVADRLVDIQMDASVLRLTDILPFAASFRTWNGHLEAFRGALLKGIAYQKDLQDYFENPTSRTAKADQYRQNGSQWLYDYGGIRHTLTGLTVDWNQHRVTAQPADMQGPDWRQYFEQNLMDRTPQTGILRAEQIRWLGAMVDLYRGSQTRIVLYQVPRGPAMPPYPRARHASTTVSELSRRPGVTILDRRRFEPLEKPELFADLEHLNADGRTVFSPMLADATKEILH